MIRRFIALALSFCLIATTIPAQAWGAATSLPVASAIVPPANLGYIAEHYKGTSPRHVILIQDLHAHLDTQKKIIGLLKFYESQGLLQRPVALEGAAGAWDLSSLASFPVTPLKQPFFDYLLAEAGITGPEWYALHTDRPRLLYGIDSMPDFEAQGELFARTLGPRRIVAAQIRQVQKLLNILEERQFKGKLHEWKEITRQFDSGQLAADHYLRDLVSLGSRVHVLPLSPLIQKVLHAQQPEDLASIAESDVFYSDLRAYGQQVGFALCHTQEQLNLVRAHYAADLIYRLMMQQLTFTEIQQLASRQRISVQLIHSLLTGSGQISWFDSSALLELVRASTDFYAAALVRNEPMARHIVGLFNQPRFNGSAVPSAPDTVIAVAGGFHTQGIVSELRRQQVSFDVIAPAITADYTDTDQARYEARLIGLPISVAAFMHHIPTSMGRPFWTTPQRTTRSTIGPVELDDPSMFGPEAVAWFARYRREMASARKGFQKTLVDDLGLQIGTRLTRDPSTGLFRISRQAKEDRLASAIDLLQKKSPDQARYMAENIQEVIILNGPMNAEQLRQMVANEILGPLDVEHVNGQLILKERMRNGHFRVWIHEESLDRYQDYLSGGRYSTDESQILMAAALLMHESAGDRSNPLFTRGRLMDTLRQRTGLPLSAIELQTLLRGKQPGDLSVMVAGGTPTDLPARARMIAGSVGPNGVDLVLYPSALQSILWRHESGHRKYIGHEANARLVNGVDEAAVDLNQLGRRVGRRPLLRLQNNPILQGLGVEARGRGYYPNVYLPDAVLKNPLGQEQTARMYEQDDQTINHPGWQVSDIGPDAAHAFGEILSRANTIVVLGKGLEGERSRHLGQVIAANPAAIVIADEEALQHYPALSQAHQLFLIDLHDPKVAAILEGQEVSGGLSVSHQDLLDYGVTFDAVVESLRTGHVSPFVRQLSASLDIDTTIARLPHVIEQFLLQPSDEAAAELMAARLHEVDVEFQRNPNHHLIAQVLRGDLDIQKSGKEQKRLQDIPDDIRLSLLREMQDAHSVSVVMGQWLRRYNEAVRDADRSEETTRWMKNALAALQLVVDAINTYKVQFGSVAHVNTVDPLGPVTTYQDDVHALSPAQQESARHFRHEQTFDFLFTAGKATRLTKSFLRILMKFFKLNEKEYQDKWKAEQLAEDICPGFMGGGMYFFNARRYLGAIYDQKVKDGEIREGDPLDIPLDLDGVEKGTAKLDQNVAHILETYTHFPQQKAGILTINRSIIDAIPDMHIGDLHWHTMVRAVRHDARELGIDPDEQMRAATPVIGVNEENFHLVYEDLRKKGFYGFLPEHIIFVSQTVHPLYIPQNEGMVPVEMDPKNNKPAGNIGLAAAAVGLHGFHMIHGQREDAGEDLENLLATRIGRITPVNDLEVRGVKPTETGRLLNGPDDFLPEYGAAADQFEAGASVSNPLGSNPRGVKGAGEMHANSLDGQSIPPALYEGLGLIFQSIDGEMMGYNFFTPFIRFNHSALVSALSKIHVTLALKAAKDDDPNSPFGIQPDIPLAHLDAAGARFRHIQAVDAAGRPSQRAWQFKEIAHTDLLVATLIALRQDPDFEEAVSFASQHRSETADGVQFSLRREAVRWAAMGVAGALISALLVTTGVWGLAVPGLLWSGAQIRKLNGRGDARIQAVPQGNTITGAISADQQNHEIAHAAGESREWMVEAWWTPLMTFIKPFYVLVGWVLGLWDHVFHHARSLDKNVQMQVAALEKFLKEGRTIVDFAHTPREGDSDSAPIVLPEESGTFGRILAYMGIHRDHAYEEARRRLSERSIEGAA